MGRGVAAPQKMAMPAAYEPSSTFTVTPAGSMCLSQCHGMTTFTEPAAVPSNPLALFTA